MAQSKILPLYDCQSDGDPSKWPGPEKGLTRNDGHFLEKIANEKWVKEVDPSHLEGHPVGRHTWRLDKLPDGFAGFEKRRAGTDNKHVDRYIYGHPNGYFRSIAEFYPHFKHLMDLGGPIGCPCKLCTGNTSRKKRVSQVGGSGGSSAGVSPARSSAYFAQPSTGSGAVRKSTVSGPKSGPQPKQMSMSAMPRGRPSGAGMLPQGRLPSGSPPRARRKQVDEDGTPDIYRSLLDKLQAGGESATMDERIVESMSPDWRAGNVMLKDLLNDWKALPRYVPRAGELVMFAGGVKDDETLEWDATIGAWRYTNGRTYRPQWEAGVVTQMPIESLNEADLTSNANRTSNVINSGFRIEPLSEPGSSDKHHSRRHQYISLHAIRPFAYWQQCITGLKESDWRPSVRHALMTASTICAISKNRFKGSHDSEDGPNATVFCSGAYIGPELILVGDTVALLPSPQEQKQGTVTDVLNVTSIKIRLVNLRGANDDDWDQGRPYNICLHISGKAYTLDPTCSFDGVGRKPIPSNSDLLPTGLSSYGQWYHVTDPSLPYMRLEIPFTRVLNRVPEFSAPNSWFHVPPTATSSFKPVNVNPPPRPLLSLPLSGLLASRTYAKAYDPRIDRAAGKSWFWADTRIEALDLHEVNGRFVGVKDESRGRKQMEEWRKALRALDGRKGGVEAFQAARREREGASKKVEGYGMVGAAVVAPAEEESEDDDDNEMAGVVNEAMDAIDAMEVDGEVDGESSGGAVRGGYIVLSDDE